MQKSKLPTKHIFILLILCTISSIELLAQNTASLDVFALAQNIENAKIVFDIKSVVSNEVVIEAQIPNGYYTYIKSDYANKILFSNNNANIATIYPKGTQKNNEIVLYGKQDFTLIFDESQHLGNVLDISYQLCIEKDNICLAPMQESISIQELNLNFNDNNLTMIGKTNILNFDIENQNVILAAILVLLAGFLSSLLPCSYPLIPITISVVSGRSITNKANNSNQKLETKTIVLSSLFFCLGLIFTYTLLGILISLIGHFLDKSIVFGSIGYNRVLLSIIVLFFMFFALSMFGLYDLHTPNFLERLKHKKLQSSLQSNKVSLLDKFLIGSIMGIVASPCAAPIVATIIEISILNPSRAIIYMALYGTGFALFLFIIGISSSLINKLPKSGAWTSVVRLAFTIAIFAIVFYYLNTLLKIIGIAYYSRSLAVLTILIVTTIAIVTRKQKAFIEKRLIIMLLALLSVSLVSTFVYDSIKPKEIPSITFEQALDLASEENKNILIDFSAPWCINCKELKKNVLSNDRLKEYIEANYIFVEIDVDKRPNIAKRYNIRWLPWLLIVDKKGREVYTKNKFANFNEKTANIILIELNRLENENN